MSHLNFIGFTQIKKNEFQLVAFKQKCPLPDWSVHEKHQTFHVQNIKQSTVKNIKLSCENKY